MEPHTVPRPRAIRLDGLGLSPTDAFVLSQIDGAVTLEDIAEITNVPLASVLDIARRLEALGAIEAPNRASSKQTTTHGRYATHVAPREKRASKKMVAVRPIPRDDAPPSSRRATRRPKQASQPRIPLVLQSLRPSKKPAPKASPPAAPAPAAAPAAPAPCDIDEDTRARIDAELVDGRNHYGVLGVPRTATKKEIQRAYFALAAAIHPDRHFGKSLGDYKRKLDVVFGRATTAYEVLRSEVKRAEYDAYLKLTQRSAQMERVLANVHVEPQASPPPAPPPKKPSVKVAVVSAPVAPSGPVATPIARPVTVSVPIAAPVVASTAAATVPVAAPTPSSPVASAPAAPVPDSRPATRLTPAQAKAAEVLAAAQKALAAGDAVAAANHYRLALHYAEDASARGYAESGLKEARNLLVDMHLKKARYEEKENRWPDAIVSYGKALEGRPDDPAICERLANALRHEGTDLVRAQQLAEAAVQRAPRRSSFRATLGMIYAESGSREKAIEQLERALEIDGSDDTVRRVLDALKKKRR
ncbi:MAG: DnaJ domain-containing protein [Myxococcales bacterium]|nr:DnaJ domain-containing protein [Myxococcales bacterium]